MRLAVRAAGDLVVVVPKDDMTARAGEAARVELAAIVGREEDAFDAGVAGNAEGVVEFVVVETAVGLVLENVEGAVGEGLGAGATGEACGEFVSMRGRKCVSINLHSRW